MIQELREFAEERDWEQLHSPKNLAMTLSVEVGELMEHFQWLTEDESRILDPDILKKAREGISDVMTYLVKIGHPCPNRSSEKERIAVSGDN